MAWIIQSLVRGKTEAAGNLSANNSHPSTTWLLSAAPPPPTSTGMEKEVNAEPLNWVTQVQTLLSFEVWPKKRSSSVSTTRYNILGLTLTHATTGFKLQSVVSPKEWEELQHFEHLSCMSNCPALRSKHSTQVTHLQCFFPLVTKVKCFSCDLATTFQTTTILKCIHFP